MKSGLAFHCYHDVLCEYVYDYDDRVEFIKKYKPKDEQKLRLKLFKLIPDDRIPGKDSEDSEEWETCYKAKEACDKAWDVRYKWKAHASTWEDYLNAREACIKAGEAYIKMFGKEIIALHKELCPNCTWDGKTIFKGVNND